MSEWISVKEVTPLSGETVLAYIINKNGIKSVQVVTYFDFHGFCTLFYGDEIDGVIYWAPLHELPYPPGMEEVDE